MWLYCVHYMSTFWASEFKRFSNFVLESLIWNVKCSLGQKAWTNSSHTKTPSISTYCFWWIAKFINWIDTTGLSCLVYWTSMSAWLHACPLVHFSTSRSDHHAFNLTHLTVSLCFVWPELARTGISSQFMVSRCQRFVSGSLQHSPHPFLIFPFVGWMKVAAIRTLTHWYFWYFAHAATLCLSLVFGFGVN